MAICASFGVFQRKVHPGENFTDNATPAQNASVCEKHEFASLRVVRYAASGKFLIFMIGNLSVLYQFCPVGDVVPLVNCTIAVTAC